MLVVLSISQKDYEHYDQQTSNNNSLARKARAGDAPKTTIPVN